MADTVRLTLAEGRALAVRALEANGCDADNAAAIADNMIRAEADICASHGLFRLPWHVQTLKVGKANGKAKPRVEKLAPAVLRVHGDRGFAPLGQKVGLPVLAAAARENGIAAMGHVDMYHVAALWPETETLAMEGLVAIACTPSFPYVAPSGASKALYGTNPIAFAWPRPDSLPLVFDQASAAMARGEIMIAAREGHSVPEGVGIDRNGRPTTDPNAILDDGAQLAFGGHKGASLALMVELLAGPLIGDLLSFEAEEDDAGAKAAPHGGELIIAMDPKRFGDPEGALKHGEKLFAAITAMEGARLPSARRYANRQKTRDGFTIPKSLHDSILATLT
ncbi:MAG: Ldh family oxidoreductase [Parvibaculaceae bacterium]